MQNATKKMDLNNGRSLNPLEKVQYAQMVEAIVDSFDDRNQSVYRCQELRIHMYAAWTMK